VVKTKKKSKIIDLWVDLVLIDTEFDKKDYGLIFATAELILESN
jgi:hypothetical protein